MMEIVKNLDSLAHTVTGVHRMQAPDVVTLVSVVKYDNVDTQEGTKQLHKNSCIFLLLTRNGMSI
jgi:hypothetical protein